MIIEVKVAGATPAEVLTKLNAAVATWTKTGATAPAKTTKKVAAPIEETEDEELSLDANDELADDMAFDDVPEYDEEVEEPAPKKTAAKAKKLTEKDVNAAALAFSKAKGRPAAMKVLAKYKVKSILELKPEQYAKVIADLKV